VGFCAVVSSFEKGVFSARCTPCWVGVTFSKNDMVLVYGIPTSDS